MALAQIGLRLHLYHLTPEELHKQIVNLTPAHNINKTLDELVEQSPEVAPGPGPGRAGRAGPGTGGAEPELHRPSAPTSTASSTGRTSTRAITSMPGQHLMALRSLERSGSTPTSRRRSSTTSHRPAGKSPWTPTPARLSRAGSPASTPPPARPRRLLPPENATGNFVKIVQRLPVRIELTEPNPPRTPLFAGLSVVPTVLIKAPPTGPNAGTRIRAIGRGGVGQTASPPDQGPSPRTPREEGPCRDGSEGRRGRRRVAATRRGSPAPKGPAPSTLGQRGILMATSTAAAPAAHAPGETGFNPWIIAGTVTIATFMEVLDTSIANVALPHIAGNLSASRRTTPPGC